MFVCVSLACELQPLPIYVTISTPYSEYFTKQVGATLTPQPTVLTVTAVQALNLRSCASKHCPSLTQLLSGASLVVVPDQPCKQDEYGEWWVNVIYEKTGGWVNENFVSKDICQ